MSNFKHYNQDQFVHFVLTNEVLAYRDERGDVRPNIGQVSFTTYTDRVGAHSEGERSGGGVMYVTGRDDKGRLKGKNFTLSQSHNTFICRLSDRDINGMSMYDFMRFSPLCEGSPNGTYVSDGLGGKLQLDVKYRLLNSDADAEVAMEAGELRVKAQASVLELDEQTLIEVAAIGIDVIGEPIKVTKFKVFEWAGKKPKDYFDILNGDGRLLKAIVRKGIKEGVLTLKGELVYWGNQLLGSSENGVVKFLIENPETQATLSERVNLKVPEKQAAKGGRPPKK